MYVFSAQIHIIDINPYVLLPDEVLKKIFADAQKEKSPIQIKGLIEGKPFLQTLVKFRGLWRLYINEPMLESANAQVGDTVSIEIAFDPNPRVVKIPKAFSEALDKNKAAKLAFEKLSPSRQKEINRYLGNLKSEATLHKNIEKTVKFLSGEKIKGVLFY